MQTQSPLILAAETSGRLGSVALADGEKLLAETTFTGPMRHSAEIFPAISDLLKRFSKKPKQIEHIYISIGPGSFTGLRIAATIAKIMHLANNAKIVTVDTLDVIAANVITTHHLTNHEPRATACPELVEGSIETIAAILDAKRDQFFIALYQRNTSDEQLRRTPYGGATSNGIWQKFLPDSLMTAEQFLENFAAKDKPIWLLGEGLVYYKDKFKTDGIQFLDEKYWRPRAEKVHLLGLEKAQAGRFANPLTLQPLYLRKPDAKIKKS